PTPTGMLSDALTPTFAAAGRTGTRIMARVTPARITNRIARLIRQLPGRTLRILSIEWQHEANYVWKD
ncbi:MAG: hypothetical protein ABIW46_09550, partial [Acidimicrobiales bacterium]